MKIEIAYAPSADEQILLKLEVAEPCTAEQAILRSGIFNTGRVGIFGKMVDSKTKLKEGDRVEIYRPLLIDPKEQRRQKAKSKR